MSIPRTIRGYEFDECASALQKSIRRADGRIASYFANELIASGYMEYVWRRLLVVSSEDVYDPVTKEIMALRDACQIVRQAARKTDPTKGRVFVTKAVLLLCRCVKSRDADDLNVLGYSGNLIPDAEAEAFIDQYCKGDRIPDVPSYALDCHTSRGRRLGATKDRFMEDERRALSPTSPTQLTFFS